MRTSLHTPIQHGYMDFLSGIIALRNREERDIRPIENALAKTKEINSNDAYIRSLVAHEVTHLMDLYTTIWGVEYTYRKNRMYHYKNTNNFEQALKVFMLNTSELESHRDLLRDSKLSSISEVTHISHHLIYDQSHGSVMMINYMKGESVALEVPLSMLSLLEANATASEYISRINDAKTQINSDVELKLIENDFICLIYNPEFSEYSLLLYVIFIHFKSDLNLEEILRFTSALSRISLDASIIFCSEFGAKIRNTFKNKIIGFDICMDLSRGMSRQIIFFKTVLLMYGWLNNLPLIKKEILLKDLKKSPKTIIDEFLNEMGLNRYSILIDFEFQSKLENLKAYKDIPDYIYARMLTDYNRAILKNESVGDKLNSLHYPAILLDDDSEANPILKIDVNHLEFVKNNIELYSKLDSIYRKNKHKKFHPPMGSGINFFNQANNIKHV